MRCINDSNYNIPLLFILNVNDSADIEVANRKGNLLIKIYELSKWQDMLTLVMWCWTVILAP